MYNREDRAEYRWIPLKPPENSDDSWFSAKNFKSLLNTTTSFFKISTAREPRSFSDALAEIGVPTTGLTPEEELIDLLENAAEIEHGLMIQYLYSLYSSKDQIISGALLNIAIEEMGHFVTVQNLLLACGHLPYLGHSDWNNPNLFQPFPFKLEPISRGSLAKYSVAEMPDPNSIDKTQYPDLEEILNEADSSAGVVVDGNRVGLLYAKIYWLLRANDEVLDLPSLEPWTGFPVEEFASDPDLAGRHVADGFLVDMSLQNATPEHWKGNHTSVIVEVITNRSDALNAIAKISEQGEGFGDTSQSHFDKFVKAWRLAENSSDLAINVPSNPWYGTSIEGGGDDEITTEIGVLFAKIGDLTYELTLLTTALYMLLPKEADSSKRNLAAKAAILTMRDCLKSAAKALSTIPLNDSSDSSSKVCGLPFYLGAVNVDRDVQSVLDRARDIKDQLLVHLAEIDESDDVSIGLKIRAQTINDVIVDDIWPKIHALESWHSSHLGVEQ